MIVTAQVPVPEPGQYVKSVLIEIHGVRRSNDGTWQHDFQAYIENTTEGVVVVPFIYDRIPAFQGFSMATLHKMGLKFITDSEIRGFKSFLKKTRDRYPNKPIDILAHSNGTFIAHEALRESDVKVRNIVLVQPVISRKLKNTDIPRLYRDGMFERMFVWSSKNDTVVGKLVRWVSLNGRLPGYGMAGYSGMVRQDSEYDKEIPRFKPFSGLPLYNVVSDETHGGVLDKGAIYARFLKSQVLRSKDVTFSPEDVTELVPPYGIEFMSFVSEDAEPG